MSLPDLPRQAEAHLRAIRSLMERATVYRAVSASTALVAGILALTACGFGLYASRPGSLLDPYQFLETWLIALVGIVALNTYYLWHAAHRRGEPFLSPGLRMALVAVAPPCVATAALTFWLAWAPEALVFAVVWCIGYGLALLATASFAPRSLVLLGWCFLLSGLMLPAAFFFTTNPLDRNTVGVVAMGVCFGLYHLVYAACVYASERRRSPEP